MPPDPLLDEEEQYASSEDSDFAPDAAVNQVSDHSESENEADKPAKKRKPVDNAEAADAGYDNSGDEAIIKKGEKRRKRAKAKRTDNEDDEGGEGGLIKTRRQRAAEKEERKYATNTGPVTVDVDALWAQMVSGPIAGAKSNETQDDTAKPDTEGARIDETADVKQISNPPAPDDPSVMIRIKRTYNFAGRVHTEEKLVPRDSAEAKLYLASQAPDAPTEDPTAKRITRKAFRSAFEPLIDPLPQRADLNLGMAARIKAGKEAQAKKLNTVEKSRMDWAGYVDKEGIKDELELAGKSKDSYTAREDFLARSEAKRDEDSRRARLTGRV
ncbi:swr complex subunit [Neonectria punicea]|uniref:SWR1-complex protein 5 n=1 Tax=Neonectria punicea TaxID=979145 RepID=A0ABR1HNL4_9HYPO